MLIKQSSISYNEGGLWLAHLLSTLGERISFITLIIVFEKLLGGANGAMVVLSMYTLTFIIASTFSGHIVDKFSKKNILIITDILRAILLLGYMFVLNSSLEYHLQAYIIGVLLFIVLIFSTIARNGFWAIVPDIVNENKISQFNSYISINENLGLAIGTAFGAILYKYWGTDFVFVLDALTYLFSAMLLYKVGTIKKVKHVEPIDEHPISKPFSWLTRNILGYSLLLLPICLFSGLLNTHAILQKNISLFGDEVDKGLFYGILALGSWFSIKLLKIKIDLKLELTFIVILTFSTLYAKNILIVVLSLFFVSGLITKNISLINTKLMKTVEPKYRGRLSSFLTFAIRTSLFLGIWLYKII